MIKGILNHYALVLETIAAAPCGLTLTEILHATGLPQGTIHRLITGLLDTGFIEPSDGRKVYVLGSRLLRILHLGTPTQVLDSLAAPVLQELVDRFKETAFLAALTDSAVQSVAMAVPSGKTQAYVQPGRVMPLHAAASAKAIFAYQDSAVVDGVLAGPLKKFTARSQIDKNGVRAELEQVRRDRFAACREELDPGIFSYACPVQLTERTIVAGLHDATNKISILLSSR